MAEPIPQKIQMIKEVREMTGFGLGHAKMLVDWLTRAGGPIEKALAEAQVHSSTEYRGSGAYSLPDLTAAPRGVVGGAPHPDYREPPVVSENLEERVTRIENWIRAESSK